MPYYVYILQSQANGRIYIGQTDDLEKRIQQHNDPNIRLGVYTKRHPGPWTIIHQEIFQTRRDAILRERELKSGKGREWIKATITREK